MHYLSGPTLAQLHSHGHTVDLAPPNGIAAHQLPYYRLRNGVGSARRAAASLIQTPFHGLVMPPDHELSQENLCPKCLRLFALYNLTLRNLKKKCFEVGFPSVESLLGLSVS